MPHRPVVRFRDVIGGVNVNVNDWHTRTIPRADITSIRPDVSSKNHGATVYDAHGGEL